MVEKIVRRRSSDGFHGRRLSTRRPASRPVFRARSSFQRIDFDGEHGGE